MWHAVVAATRPWSAFAPSRSVCRSINIWSHGVQRRAATRPNHIGRPHASGRRHDETLQGKRQPSAQRLPDFRRPASARPAQSEWNQSPNTMSRRAVYSAIAPLPAVHYSSRGNTIHTRRKAKAVADWNAVTLRDQRHWTALCGHLRAGLLYLRPARREIAENKTVNYILPSPTHPPHIVSILLPTRQAQIYVYAFSRQTAITVLHSLEV